MVSFGELKEYTRIRTNTENNNAITDRALSLFLNMSLGTLYNIIVTDYEDYFVNKYLTTLNGDTGNQIPIPPDFMKLRAVDYGAPGSWTTVYNFMLEERNRMNNPIANMVVPFGNLAARRVRTMNNAVFVEPENLSQGQYQIWYIPKYKNLELDTDLLIPAMDTNGWVEYAVCSAGAKVFNALTLTAAAQSLMVEMKDYEQIVRNGANNRNANDAQAVVNTRNVTDWNFGGSDAMSGGWGG